MARRYEQVKHGSVASLKFWRIGKIPPLVRGGDIINKLLQREAYWIFILNTTEPYGLNVFCDCACTRCDMFYFYCLFFFVV